MNGGPIARTWAANIWEDAVAQDTARNPNYGTWANFETALEAQFCNPSTQQNAMQSFLSVKQKPGETAIQFLSQSIYGRIYQDTTMTLSFYHSFDKRYNQISYTLLLFKAGPRLTTR
jgi:hypothetical protein